MASPSYYQRCWNLTKAAGLSKFFLSEDYVIGRVFLSQPEPLFCSTAVLLVLSCNIGYRALTHCLEWAMEPVWLRKKYRPQVETWRLPISLLWLCFSEWWWPLGEMLHNFQLYQGFCLVVIECSLLSVCYLTVTWWYVSFIYLSAYLWFFSG